MAATRWWRSPLLLAGLAVWVACLVVWSLVWAASAARALKMGATFATFLLGGKLAAVPAGFALGLSHAEVGLLVLLPDVGAVLVGYPLTQGGLKVLGRWSHFVRQLHDDALRAAERKEGLVARYGDVGLFLLALTPVAFISPLVVSAIGQIMGLSARRVLVPVFAGMAVMTLALVLLVGAGVSAVARVDARLPFVLSGLILLLVVGREFVLRRRNRRAQE